MPNRLDQLLRRSWLCVNDMLAPACQAALIMLASKHWKNNHGSVFSKQFARIKAKNSIPWIWQNQIQQHRTGGLFQGGDSASPPLRIHRNSSPFEHRLVNFGRRQIIIDDEKLFHK